MPDTPRGSAADETPDQAALDSINVVVEHARPDEDFGSGLAPDPAAQWPDELDDTIAEFSAQHPWVWRRTLIRSWIEQRIGRWLPWLCRHRSAVGPVDGPLRCMDCGRPTDA